MPNVGEAAQSFGAAGMCTGQAESWLEQRACLLLQVTEELVSSSQLSSIGSLHWCCQQMGNLCILECSKCQSALQGATAMRPWNSYYSTSVSFDCV